MKRRGRTMYITQDVEVEIGFDDIMDYIDDYATDDELKIIAQSLEEDYLGVPVVKAKTLEDTLKLELLTLAFNKYSLSELEDKLGTKFELS